MKKIIYMITAFLFSFSEAKAIENNCTNPNIGDYFYSDGTCSSTIQSSKQAIGLVYWISNKKKGGLIVSFDEPESMAWKDAINYCKSYTKNGIGGWKLPEVKELITMATEYPHDISNNKSIILYEKFIASGNKYIFGSYWSGNDALIYDKETYNYITDKNVAIYHTMYSDSGGFGVSGKVDSFRVRCVLAF